MTLNVVYNGPHWRAAFSTTSVMTGNEPWAPVSMIKRVPPQGISPSKYRRDTRIWHTKVERIVEPI